MFQSKHHHLLRTFSTDGAKLTTQQIKELKKKPLGKRGNFFWKKEGNQREFFETLIKEFNIKNPEDWYSIKVLDIKSKGGYSFLEQFGGSLQKALLHFHPEVDWKPWLFSGVPPNFWQKRENHISYINWLAKKLGIIKLEDWYGVQVTDVIENHGAPFLRHFGDSLPNALRSLFPEQDWKEFLFSHKGTKNLQPSEAIEFINYLEEKLCISSWKEWVDVSVQHVIRYGGSSLVVGYGHRGLINFLSKKYPEVTFSEFDFKNSLLKTQKLIYRFTKNIFPNYAEAVQFNARHPKLFFKDSQQNMSLDIFIEPLDLAIEYQGIHHHDDTRFFGPSQIQKNRDEEKRKACKELGITLIEVGSEWDFKKETLIDSIAAKRPELFGRNKEAFKSTPIVKKEEIPKVILESKYENAPSSQEDAYKLFLRIHGANNITVQKWIDKGFRTLDDLRKSPLNSTLNTTTRIGLKYYDDFLKKIPREEVEEISSYVSKKSQEISPDLETITCGSYRRGKTECSDIDILVTTKDFDSSFPLDSLIPSLVSKLWESGFITDGILLEFDNSKKDIEVGVQKYAGVCKLKGNSVHRRIDIRVFSRKQLPCALLYFTGSATFNWNLRNWAKKKGFQINQQQITYRDNPNVEVNVKTEEDIFKLLDIAYKTPAERDL